MAATLALSAESFVGRAEMVTGSYEISTGAYVETLHGARMVPTAEGMRATNPRRGKRVKAFSASLIGAFRLFPSSHIAHIRCCLMDDVERAA